MLQKLTTQAEGHQLSNFSRNSCIPILKLNLTIKYISCIATIRTVTYLKAT
jgi:hypothetical protein